MIRSQFRKSQYIRPDCFSSFTWCVFSPVFTRQNNNCKLTIPVLDIEIPLEIDVKKVFGKYMRKLKFLCCQKGQMFVETALVLPGLYW